MKRFTIFLLLIIVTGCGVSDSGRPSYTIVRLSHAPYYGGWGIGVPVDLGNGDQTCCRITWCCATTSIDVLPAPDSIWQTELRPEYVKGIIRTAGEQAIKILNMDKDPYSLQRGSSNRDYEAYAVVRESDNSIVWCCADNLPAAQELLDSIVSNPRTY